RSKNIFSIAQPEDASKDFIPIHSEKVNVSGSSDLITMVANDQADLAAVWDGTIKKYTQPNDDVVFISLPYAVPNDLLVCSKKLNDQTKDSITRAIDNKTFRSTAEEMGKTNDLGDVYSWVTMGRAPAAEQALANLRHLAQIDAYGVTVRVSSPGGSLVSQASLDAINRGIKLSQTEFVPYDPAYHKHADYNWTVSSTHDGAISLSSEIDGFDIEPQVIPISFTDAEDLSKRVSQLIHSRLHRIRYIWPYEDETPTVIRDFDFAISAGSLIRARKVVWQDPRIDAATRDLAFDVNVVKSDFHTLRLNGFILQHDRSLGFDPMSNVSYQVLLIRPNDESLMFKTMTYGFVIVLGLAALAAIYDFRRRTRAAVPEAAQGDLKQMYRSTLARYYKSWRATSSDGKREIAGANVIWCNRAFLEKFIAGLKNSAQINSTVRIQTGWNLFAKIPLIKDYVGLGAGVERSIDYTWIYDPTAVDDPERLSGVVPFLIESELLAPFVGTQLEWEALNIIALNAVQRNQVTPQVTLNGHNKVLSRDNPFLQSLVSQHFHEVLDLSLPRAAFFNQTWQLTAENDGQRIFQYHESINYQNGSDSTSADRMVLSFTLPKEAFLNGDLVDGKLSAWLLGRIQKRDIDLENGARSLRIEFKPLALLKE
ncbi:MAG TPA: hypothetical protein VE863_06560, partial [Pyrinomonadaceae bacterium]|nr:hypothetical protein [Pyrinomonadaceae bacterium]